MHVDRQRFLALALGMAGVAACNQGPAATGSARIVEIPRQPPPPEDAGVAPVVAAPKPKPVAAPTDEDAVAEDDDDPGDPTDEGGGGVASSTCGFVSPASVKRPAGKCSDDLGVAPTCAMMTACGGFGFPKQRCETYRAKLRPGAAGRALRCLAGLSAKQRCDACAAYRCGDLALKSSCPDPKTAAICTRVRASCKSVAQSECETYMSGLNAAGQAKLASCLSSTSGCRFGIFSCSESL